MKYENAKLKSGAKLILIGIAYILFGVLVSELGALIFAHL